MLLFLKKECIYKDRFFVQDYKYKEKAIGLLHTDKGTKLI